MRADEAIRLAGGSIPKAESATRRAKKAGGSPIAWQFHKYFQWAEKEFSAEPGTNVSVIVREPAPSWTTVQEKDLLSQFVVLDPVKIGELVHERLRQGFGAVFGYTQGIDEIKGELTRLRQMLCEINERIDHLTLNQGVCVPIHSFAPEPFELAGPIDILISAEDDGYLASFLDGNLHAYGETKEEALSNMKATIVETYKRLRELPDDRLGRSMVEQKQVLSYLLRERAQAS